MAATLPSTHFSRATFLMCSPEWYDVGYVINPWMAGNLHRPTRDASFAQWRGLYEALGRIADVKLLHPRQGSPDMVFVGHTALVHHGVAAVSSFAHAERQPEERHLRRWLQEAGFLLWDTPRETCFEGEGDALFDSDGRHLWAAHGARTCKYSHGHVAEAWHVQVTSLHLVDPRFYHLDTCFAPLSGGRVLYYPGAFDAMSLALIEAAYPAERRIMATESEAAQFGCNVINIGRDVLMHKASGRLAERLRAAGYAVTELPLGEFLKGGGSAKSLALRLSDLSVTYG
ncbi:dimethylarginine dimethylaminohydrolase family protein [Granulicella tundricola]|uniref:dimethylarginine dimethylaminohydrolase family protein n=1 Tax=Granulicella tundricola TaxID=940615 RepID=UPI001E5F5F7A|nr:arginine deiminase-related protein [Granulicella tundricola]